MKTTNETINKIKSIEWEMFSAVNEGQDKASCQEDRETFEGMRAAQFEAWPAEATSSYLADLETALKDNRSLVEEKYIHMMQTTDPAQYEALLPRVKMPAETAVALAAELSDILLKQTLVLHEEYPFITGRGRPLYSELDYITTSVETYQLCELLTYSEKTLAALLAYVKDPERDGASMVKNIQENTIRFYGFDSLEQAEALAKSHAERPGTPMVFGCAGGSCEEE